jgi:hypothetical protein
MQNGGGKGWQWDPESGQKVMPDLWVELLEWLLSDPRHPATQAEWAEEHGLHPDSITRIKRDPRFVKEWERKAAEKNISVDRVQGVVDSLHKQAMAGDVKAASLYLQYIDRFTPKSRVVIEDKSLKDLSDEELMAEVAELAEQFGD